MMGKTHFFIGLGTGAMLAVAANADPLHIGAMSIAAGVGALLPDIDHRHAPIRQRLGFVGDVLLFWLPHRGLTHSLLCWMALTAVAFMVLPLLHMPLVLALALSAGYASHILADMTTKRGLPIFYPVWRQDCYILPPGFRVTTGGISENVAFLLFLIGLILLYANMRGLILPRRLASSLPDNVYTTESRELHQLLYGSRDRDTF